MQRHQQGVLTKSKVGELWKNNSFLRARKQHGKENLDGVHNHVEELQLRERELQEETKKFKSFILEDEAMDEDSAAEEKKNPEVQSEEKQRPEENTTDHDMSALIPGEGDAPVLNEKQWKGKKGVGNGSY